MARTRSPLAHTKVLNATLELVAAHGIEGTSMDAVSKQSGISKATIYKHWTNKDALLLEVMAYVNGLADRPDFDSGNPKADIAAVLAYRSTEHAELREQIMPHLIAYSARNAEFGAAWRNMVMEPPRRELRRLIKQAIERHELTCKLNTNIALALLLGPMMYWHIFLRQNSKSPEKLAKAVTDAFWRAHRVP